MSLLSYCRKKLKYNPKVYTKYKGKWDEDIAVTVRELCQDFHKRKELCEYHVTTQTTPSVLKPIHSGHVIIAKGDTFECFRRFHIKHPDLDTEKCMALNFANAYGAGGGWEQGHGAQEEMLFYRSSYFIPLELARAAVSDQDEPYLTLKQCVVTPHVYVWGSYDEGRNVIGTKQEDDSDFIIAMLAAAGPDYRGKKCPSDKVIQAEMGNLWETIFKSAMSRNIEHFFIGPIGCGVFVPNTKIQHYKEVAAQVAAQKIEKYRRYFHSIVFVDFVPSRDYEDPSSNYAIFSEAITKHVSDVVCDYCNHYTCARLEKNK